MNGDVTRIVTDDGSHSLYVPDLRETYHSTHGAMRESEHVYIKMGLEECRHREKINILEVGFGTGLNVLLTAHWSFLNQHQVNLTTIEAFPLSPDMVETLNYPDLVDSNKAREWWQAIHNASWDEITGIHEYFTLEKLHLKLENFDREREKYDCVYYDAFAPGKQPGMWTKGMLDIVKKSMKDEGVLVTYCAQGQFKRNLSDLGFNVVSLDGPPGKKEMVRAIKLKG